MPLRHLSSSLIPPSYTYNHVPAKSIAKMHCEEGQSRQLSVQSASATSRRRYRCRTGDIAQPNRPEWVNRQRRRRLNDKLRCNIDDVGYI